MNRQWLTCPRCRRDTANPNHRCARLTPLGRDILETARLLLATLLTLALVGAVDTWIGS